MKRDDVLFIRAGIFASLLVREGQLLDNAIAMDRANNCAQWLEATIDDIVNEALKEAARGVVVGGEIGAVPAHAVETAEMHAQRIIK